MDLNGSNRTLELRWALSWETTTHSSIFDRKGRLQILCWSRDIDSSRTNKKLIREDISLCHTSSCLVFLGKLLLPRFLVTVKISHLNK